MKVDKKFLLEYIDYIENNWDYYEKYDIYKSPVKGVEDFKKERIDKIRNNIYKIKIKPININRYAIILNNDIITNIFSEDIDYFSNIIIQHKIQKFLKYKNE